MKDSTLIFICFAVAGTLTLPEYIGWTYTIVLGLVVSVIVGFLEARYSADD